MFDRGNAWLQGYSWFLTHFCDAPSPYRLTIEQIVKHPWIATEDGRTFLTGDVQPPQALRSPLSLSSSKGAARSRPSKSRTSSLRFSLQLLQELFYDALPLSGPLLVKNPELASNAGESSTSPRQHHVAFSISSSVEGKLASSAQLFCPVLLVTTIIQLPPRLRQRDP